MRASSEDNFYKAGWWNGIDDPEAGLKGHALAIDYQANGLDMTVFCTSITNKAHQTDDYRLATNAIYSKLLGTDFNVESGETPEPTPNPDTKPDTGKDTQSPETGDGMTHTVTENSPFRLTGRGGCFFGGLPEMGKCGMILKNIFPGGAL